MKKILVLVALAFGIAVWFQQREKTAYLRVVETPGQSNAHDAFRPVVAPNRKAVNPDDPVSTIRWTAFQAEDHTAPPLVLSIKKEQWLKTPDSSPVYEDNIGPMVIQLRMSWPLLEEFVGQEKLYGEPPLFAFSRVPQKKRSPQKIKSTTILDGIYFVSPPDTPPGESILVTCQYAGCLMRFEYQGRPAEIMFGSHRQQDWETGYNEAMEILRSITVN